MSVDAKSGPLTQADLLAIWTAAVDRGYQEPLIAAGEGNGLEAYTQAMAQLERAATAVDVTTQALYARPWSGQTAAPAAGPLPATVQLSFTRTLSPELAIRIPAGQGVALEETDDWGELGAEAVLTGRRYVLSEDLVFLPGELGPILVEARSDRPGWGYNNPLPGTIKVIEQLAKGFYHDRATLDVSTPDPTPDVHAPPPNLSAVLVTVNESDMFVPEHVGQYVLFTAGSNAGLRARASAYYGPDASLPKGSAVVLEAITAFETTSTPVYTLGETVKIHSGATVKGWARVIAVHSRLGGGTRVGLVLLAGALVPGDAVLGMASTATSNVQVVTANPVYVQETCPPHATAGQGANWRILDWALDFGLAVTNEAAPAGGRLGMLDALGAEKNIPRAIGEVDDFYRPRVTEIADVVTPNAIKRAIVRVLGTLPYCFREVGSELLPGFYNDVAALPSAGDAYDYDTVLCTGVLSTGSFIDPQAVDGYQERVEYRDSDGNVKMSGWFGRSDAGDTELTFIRRQGYGSLANPLVWASGDTVNGLTSGFVFDVSAATPSPSFAARRFHEYLDYTQMRAFFLVGVPRLDLGEFGFAWGVTGGDNSPHNAYDASPFNAFFDGYPVGNAAVYGPLWAAIEKARAGGVGFELYLEDGSCA